MKKNGLAFVENEVEVAAENPEAAAAAAVALYDPQTDFRVWRQLAEVWRQQCSELCEIAAGLASDGRPAGEIARRLRTDLESRAKQDFFEEAAAKFSKLASEWAAGQKSDALTKSLNRQIEALEAERRAAAEANARKDEANRLARAADLERQAAALREGPSRVSSYLAR